MLSDLVNITHGTQETVLEPILFLIYINGLLNLNDDSTVSFYADDTAIITSYSVHSDNYNDLYKT